MCIDSKFYNFFTLSNVDELDCINLMILINLLVNLQLMLYTYRNMFGFGWCRSALSMASGAATSLATRSAAALPQPALTAPVPALLVELLGASTAMLLLAPPALRCPPLLEPLRLGNPSPRT